MNPSKRKEEIIDAAYRLFSERGYDEVAVSDICHACKITKPTFYKYINSKEELLVRFYDGLIDILMDELNSRLDDDDYLEQALFGLSFSVDKSVELGHDIYSRYLEYIFHDHYPTTRYASAATPFIKSALKKAQETGQIQNMDTVDNLFFACRNMTLGLSCKWCFGPGDFDLLAAVRNGQEMILRPNWEVIAQAKTNQNNEPAL